MNRRSSLLAFATVALLTTLLLGPSLVALARVVSMEPLAYSADAYTHYLRAVFLREYWLPSGHHWGWDPFWYQGFVPFLLYPHLMYAILALVTGAAGTASMQATNVFTVALLVAPALAAGTAVLRRNGLAAAVVVTAWFVALDSLYGAGLRGLFALGLLTQQFGLALFTLLAWDLVVTRRIERAALWLGLLGLSHVHSTLVASVCWAVFAAEGLVAGDNEERRRWLLASLAAAAAGTPTLLGLFHGWGQVGASTGMGQPDVWLLFVRGFLAGPWPTIVAVGLACMAAAAGAPQGRQRRRLLVATALVALLAVVSVQNLVLDTPILNRLARFVLRLRTAPYAFALAAMVAVAGWRTMARPALALVVVLTAGGTLASLASQAAWADRLGNEAGWRQKPDSPLALGFEAALDWIAADAGARTVTVALINEPKPRIAHPIQRLTDRLRQPALGGHGLELSSVRNVKLVNRWDRMSCVGVRNHVQRHAIGYILTHDDAPRAFFAECFASQGTVRRGPWSVWRTGTGWDNYAPIVRSFSHDQTWTRLTWRLEPLGSPWDLALPMAATGPWRATLGGRRTATTAETSDGMLSVHLPAGTTRLALEFEGYAGEWTSVALSAIALAWLAWTARRRSPVTDDPVRA